MTLDDLVTRFRSLGFVCYSESLGRVTKVAIGILPATPGNRVESSRGPWGLEVDPDHVPAVDGPAASIRIEGDEITMHYSHRIPGPLDPYEARPFTIDELYEELLHYWFYPDSPMSIEDGFLPGPGRPPGA